MFYTKSPLKFVAYKERAYYVPSVVISIHGVQRCLKKLLLNCWIYSDTPVTANIGKNLSFLVENWVWSWLDIGWETLGWRDLISFLFHIIFPKFLGLKFVQPSLDYKGNLKVATHVAVDPLSDELFWINLRNHKKGGGNKKLHTELISCVYMECYKSQEPVLQMLKVATVRSNCNKSKASARKLNSQFVRGLYIETYKFYLMNLAIKATAPLLSLHLI